MTGFVSMSCAYLSTATPFKVLGAKIFPPFNSVRLADADVDDETNRTNRKSDYSETKYTVCLRVLARGNPSSFSIVPPLSPFYHLISPRS